MAAYFSKDALAFLAELKQNNNREWFAKHKARYEKNLRDPMLQLISDLAPRMKKLSGKLVVDPRPVGGSMFRIYRDTRFAKDKSPYKTHVAAFFGVGRAHDGSAPGFYLHLEPKESTIGGGVWHPEPPALKSIRDAIVDDGARWRKVTSGKTLGAGCTWHGEVLKRAPRGYDEHDPNIEHIKRKDFALGVPLTDKQILGPKLPDEIIKGYKSLMPFMSFLSNAVGAKL